MGVAWDSIPATERNGRLTKTGYGINFLIALTCLGTLLYPFLDAGGVIRMDCLFRSITSLPCPTCGYSSAIGCLISGEPAHSFLHNPAWIFWIVFQVGMVYIGTKSILSGKQVVLPHWVLFLIILLIIVSWTSKFIIGSDYY